MRKKSVKKKNTNCLEGFRCPKCGQEDELLVCVTTWASLKDAGIDPETESVDNMGGFEWNGESHALCPKCDYGRGDPDVNAGEFFMEL